MSSLGSSSTPNMVASGSSSPKDTFVLPENDIEWKSVCTQFLAYAGKEGFKDHLLSTVQKLKKPTNGNRQDERRYEDKMERQQQNHYKAWYEIQKMVPKSKMFLIAQFVDTENVTDSWKAINNHFNQQNDPTQATILQDRLNALQYVNTGNIMDDLLTMINAINEISGSLKNLSPSVVVSDSQAISRLRQALPEDIYGPTLTTLDLQPSDIDTYEKFCGKLNRMATSKNNLKRLHEPSASSVKEAAVKNENTSTSLVSEVTKIIQDQLSAFLGSRSGVSN